MTAKLILFSVLSLFVISFQAYGDVLVKDTRTSSISTNIPASVSSGDIETGDGEAGNYVVIVCANDNGGSNNFNEPIPDGWTELDEGLCGGNLCGHGIWGKFFDNPNSESISCTWSPDSILFAAGSIRYEGVDAMNPVVGVACNSGSGVIAVAPSIDTLPGSQVLRVFTSGFSLVSQMNADNSPTTRLDGDISGNFLAQAGTLEFNRALTTRGMSDLNEHGGPTGEAEFDHSLSVDWRACTISIGMLNERNVPTMNEWGLISMAGVLGIIGLFAIQRRKAKA